MANIIGNLIYTKILFALLHSYLVLAFFSCAYISHISWATLYWSYLMIPSNLVLKAKNLKHYKNELIREKRSAFEDYTGQQAHLNLKQKYRRKLTKLRRGLKRCCTFPKSSYLYKPCFNIRHEGTYENFTAKSVAGFLGGFFLTYIFFMFFVLQLNFKLSTAMIMCSIFGSILTIGLAFSYNVRCVVFLVLPQFFSKKGRQALLAYAYILAITGPAKNTLNNMSILGESLACGQEQLKDAVRQIIAAVKKPFYAIRDAIKEVVKAIKKIVIKIKEILLAIKRIIISLLKIIRSAFQFIAKIMNMCNKEIGTPFQRCQKVFEDAILDCNAKLGPIFNWLCNITYLVKSVCYIAKVLDFVCIIVDFIKDTVSTIITKVKQFVRHMRTMFYVRIKFSHSYHFETNRTKSMSDITTGIVTEIKQRSSGLIKIFDFMSCAASLFFIFMIVKVIYYRQRFLTNEEFDNKFITKYFRQIDLKRAQLGLETVLPLNHRERQHYITTSSLRLVKQEKAQQSKSAMVLLMATFKLATHMATDYSLYWIMTLIRYYGRFQSKVKSPNIPGIHIEGTGFLANLLKAIVKAFQPLGISLEIDTVPCLPDPIPPDYDRYVQIASLLALCWFLAIFEPYGLRLRNSVMCYYHPQRARERAIWLYNNIMRSRSSFLKFARRQLRRKVMGDKNITKITCMDYIRAKLYCKIFRIILGTKFQSACLLCGEVKRESDKYIKCQTPSCPGLYCERCFADLQNLCTVCLDPIQYGDLSDVSEEKDSSEEEDAKRRQKRQKKNKKNKKTKKSGTSNTDDSDESTDEHSKSNDKKKLLKNQPYKDSDYYSSKTESTGGNSTDYSYSYQDNKDITKKSDNPPPPRSQHKDIEKQNIPEHATMESFRPTKHSTPVTTASTDDQFNSTSTAISMYNETERVKTDHTSLGHLNANYKRRPSGSKLSINNSISDSPISSKSSETLNDDYYSSSPISELSRSTKKTSKSVKSKKSKKANSKISTESIPLESLPSGSSKHSRRNPYLQNVETTFVLTPALSEDHTVGYESHDSEKTSLITELEEFAKEVVHPDVPKLNLNFLKSKESSLKPCGCTISTRSNVSDSSSSCNCRLFKEKVKYVAETERKRSKIDIRSNRSKTPSSDDRAYTDVTKTNPRLEESDASSSLISSLCNIPTKFSVTPALSPISVGGSKLSNASGYDSPVTSVIPSPSYRTNQYDTPKTSDISHDSKESVSFDYKYDSVGEDSSSNERAMYRSIVPSTTIVENAPDLRRRHFGPSKDRKSQYNKRIRRYYRSLDNEQYINKPLPLAKQGPFKKMFNIFKSSKK